MRVVCVNDKWAPTPAAVNNPQPKIGDEFTVKDEIYVRKFNAAFYEFVEYPDCFYLKTMFVELPDAEPETVTEEETLLQTV